MTSIKGSFSGRITKQSAISLTDQPNHGMSIAEVSGTQKSRDPLWNNANITYWGVTDVLGAKGTQRGYFDNLHADKGRDWGTFEGKVSTKNGSTTVAGTWKYADGDGTYRGIKGGGKFKVVMKSETEIECSWSGDYKLRKSK
jgi:hypothetical protein